MKTKLFPINLSTPGAVSLLVSDLRCEYLTNPLGIDETLPRLSWVLSVTDPKLQRGTRQTAYQVLVASDPGKLAEDRGDIWDSGKVTSTAQNQIVYGGIALTSRMRCHWKVRVWDEADRASAWSEPALWTVGLLEAKDWQGDWIGGKTDSCSAARHLRREFGAKAGLTRATVYLCGLGLYELHLNGAKVGNDVMVPACTRYASRVFYLTYDVTEQIKRGTNAIGVMLGGGRFAFGPGSGGGSEIGEPMLLLQLELEYADGLRETIASDPSWAMTLDGPIREQSEYNGEVYDARMELPGWDRAGYNDSSWRRAEKVAGPPGQIRAQMTPPVRVTEVLKPVSFEERVPGVYVFDMGQNMTGWCRLKVKGTAGTCVTMRFAEVLREDGTLEWDTMLKARPQDTYTLKGGGEETYTPRFTYHGFRFVEVLGLPYRPDLSLLEGEMVHDDLPAAGRFTCSNDRLTRIHNAARWGIRGNYKSIPTDCPQRAERDGWTGDRLEVHRSEQYFFRGVAFYRKWLKDIANSAAPDGTIGCIAPGGIPDKVVSVTWPGVCINAPETLRLFYGDTRTIEEHYCILRRFVERLTGYIKDDLMPLDEYGDWCPPPRKDEPTVIHTQLPARRTVGPLIGTSYFNRLLSVMRGYAELLGKKEDAARFDALAEQMKRGLNAWYFNTETAVYGKGSQTSYVLPLAFNLVPEAQRERVLENFVNTIRGEHQSHIGTGVIGGAWLMRVLTDNGYGDLAYTMATRPDYPGWGFMIESGATTIWELFNAPTADKLMNSRNHVMQIGDLGIWLYGYLAGIAPDPARPGFEHIIMRPMPLGDLTWVDASYASIRGEIVSSWKIDDRAFIWHVTVPPNATATLYIPTHDADGVTESGRQAADADGLRFVGIRDGRCTYEAGSGSYALRCTMQGGR